MDADIPVRVLDMVDLDSQKWAECAQHAGWPMRAVWAREARTLLAFERQAAAAFDRTLFVSNEELQDFAELAPECAARACAIANGVDLARFAPAPDYPDPYPASAGPRIVFTGIMNYWPNADAAAWFARSVLPAIRAQAPQAEFYVVGANPSREVRSLQRLPGVQVIGRVPDIRPWIAHASVAVAPLRIARGIQNKVLEAMAMARPVVASQQAYAGLSFAPGRDLLVANGALEMTQKVIEVLAGRHPALGQSARRAVEEAHNWEVTLSPLDALFASDRAASSAAAPPLAQAGALA
jgi:sugar transferase (PEP-CTERM/EpsH1 system associated)